MKPARGRAARAGAGLILLAAVSAATAGAAAPEERADERPRRFQIEIYGGIGRPGLSGINSLADAGDAVQEFGYDRLLEYQQQAGLIAGWSKDLTGARRPIGTSVPFGLRARWRLSAPLALSLGVRLSCARRESNYIFSYTRIDPDGYEGRETVAHNPYLLSAGFLAVLAGVHFSRPLSRNWSVEASLAAGPVFAGCEHVSSWEYTWHRRGPDEDWDVFRMAGRLEESGRGTGIAADLGLRLQRALGRRLSLFLEGAYSLQSVRTIKGSGRETRDDALTEWEGTWAFKKETIRAPWGTLETETPTCYWPEGSASSRSRDFRLDGSGLQARAGLSFLF